MRVFKRFMICCLLLGATMAVNAASWVVQNSNNSGAGSLRTAIANAKDGDLITFSSSVKTITLGGEILINKKNLTIDGGTGVTITREGALTRLLNCTATEGTLTLRGLTFKEGNLDGVFDIFKYDASNPLAAFINCGDGGAVRADCHVTALNCNFTDNKIKGRGGALWTAGDANLTNCNFTGNEANTVYEDDISKIEGYGGAVFSDRRVVATNCLFSNNIATRVYFSLVGANNATLHYYYGGSGGAIYASSQSNLSDCNFSDNTAGDYGGGVYFYNNADLTNCTFSGNKSGRSGGGIYCEVNVNLNKCSFIKNKATGYGGGGVWAGKGSAHSTDCLFSENETMGTIKDALGRLTLNNNSGGGLCANVGNFTNCIFYKNISAAYGGGLCLSGNQYATGQNTGLYGCTFDGNMSGDKGGAFFGFNSGYALYENTYNIDKCIFTNNSSCDGAALYSVVGNLYIKDCAFSCNEGKLSIVQSESGSWNSYSYRDDYICSVLLINSTFLGNSVVTSQGSVNNPLVWEFPSNMTTGLKNTMVKADEVTMAHCTFANNKMCKFTDYYNGGFTIKSYGGSIVLVKTSCYSNNCLFVSNNEIAGIVHRSDESTALNEFGDPLAGTGGNNKISNNSSYSSFFGNNTLTGNYLSPLPGKATGATRLPGGAQIDAAGNTRPDGNGKCTYGAVETTARSYIVTNSNNSGAGSLRQCINDANSAGSADKIIVTFDPAVSSFNINLASSISFSKNIDIIGRLNSDGTPAITINGSSSSNVFNYTGTGTATFYGLAINNGTMTASGGGGAIYTNTGSIKADYCTFTGNKATHSSGTGGAIYASGSVSKLTNCKFDKNSSTSHGGAVYAPNYIEASNCSFTNNISGAYGGGVCAKDAELMNCIFTGNSGNFGGAFCALSGWSWVNGCVFYNNKANSGGAIGGNSPGSAIFVLTNSTLSGNTANTSGGAVYNGSTSYILHNTITNNKGGGIYASAGTSSYLYNNIVTGNTNTTSATLLQLAGPGTINYTTGRNLVEEQTIPGSSPAMNVNHRLVFGTNAFNPNTGLHLPFESGIAFNGAPAINSTTLSTTPGLSSSYISLIVSLIGKDQTGANRSSSYPYYGAVWGYETLLNDITANPKATFKTVYNLNEEIDYANIALGLNYSNGSGEIISTTEPGVTNNGASLMNTVGYKNLNFTYRGKTSQNVGILVGMSFIESVSMNIDEPNMGIAPKTVPASNDSPRHYDIGNATWTPNDATFKAYESYTVSFDLTAHETYAFTEQTTAMLNGATATCTPSADGSKLTVTYTFRIIPAITMTATPNPATYRENVTIMAKVLPSYELGVIPTGTVDFYEAHGGGGYSNLGTVALSEDGEAVLNISTLKPGSYAFFVEYSGDDNFFEKVEMYVNTFIVSPIGGDGDGSESNPYLISTATDLDYIRENLSAHYKLANDIDLAPYLASGGLGYNQWLSSGWMPIGTYSAPFTGSIDGDGYIITGLWIDRPTTNYVGLFGYAAGTISNLGISGGEIIGYDEVGALAGHSTGNINNCYSTCNITGNRYVGGLVGYLQSVLSNCYATGDVTGEGTDQTDIGGLAGYLGTGGSSISYSYAAGKVTGMQNVGGLLGRISGSGVLNNCFFDTQTTARQYGVGSNTTATGVSGKTTADMKKATTFAGWNFTATWGIFDNYGYPYLSSFGNHLLIEPTGGSKGYDALPALTPISYMVTPTGNYDETNYPLTGELAYSGKDPDFTTPGNYAIVQNTLTNSYYQLSFKNDESYLISNTRGLIFEAVNGKFYMDMDGTGTLSAANLANPYTNGEYAIETAWNWRWNASNKTLTLYDFVWETAAATALTLWGGSFTIYLNGNNIFTAGDGQTVNSYGISIPQAGTISFVGANNGSLTATAGSTTAANSRGINSMAAIELNNSTFTNIGKNAATSSEGISCSNITFNSGSLLAQGHTRALSSQPDFPSEYTWVKSANYDGSASETNTAPANPFSNSGDPKYVQIFKASELFFHVSESKFYLGVGGPEYTGQADKWSFSNDTLYLNGFVWETGSNVALRIAYGNLTINLAEGSVNTFKSVSSTISTGITAGSNVDLTITGYGTLNVVATTTFSWDNTNTARGMSINSLTINSGMINVSSSNTGASNDATIHGIRLNGNLYINDGSLNVTTEQSAGIGSSYGIYFSNVFDGIQMNGGELKVSGHYAAIARAFFVNLPDFYAWESSFDADGGDPLTTGINPFDKYTYNGGHRYLKFKTLSTGMLKGIFYVDETKSGYGSSWEDAYPNLSLPLILAAKQYSGAIEVAETDTIRAIYMAEGTYNPIYNANGYHFVDQEFPTVSSPGNGRNNAFVLVPGVKIYGGFVPGDLDDEYGVPDFGAKGRNGVTTLSGKLDATTNTYNVIIGADIPADSGTLIDGVTITGGIADADDDITINGKTVRPNKGGGMSIFDASPTIANVTISGNSGSQAGGMNIDNSSPTLVNVMISGNSAEVGGGIGNYYSNSMLINVVISGNISSDRGGGMYNANSQPTLVNVTISGNKATPYGGGILNANSSQTQVKNSIIWGNTAGSNSNVYSSTNSVLVYDHCIVGDITAAGVISADDPKFVNWIDPSTATMPNILGNYSLMETSPAINAGDYNLFEEIITETQCFEFLQDDTDLAGNRRLSGSSIDLGAFEFQEIIIVPEVIRFSWNAGTTEKSFTLIATSGEPFTVDWGDGTTTPTTGTGSEQIISHTYSSDDSYDVVVTTGSADGSFTYLDCSNNQVTALDVSEATELQFINSSGNYLPLSDLFAASERISVQNEKLLGDQTLSSVILNTGDSYGVGQNNFASFDTEYVVLKESSPAVPDVDYSVTTGIISFITAGNYTITMTNDAIESNTSYPAEVMVEIEVNSSVLPTFGVSIGNFAHGEVSADRTAYEEGETVTLTLFNIDTGYELSSIVVAKNSDNSNVPFTSGSGKDNGATYTFTLPDEGVTVTAIFGKNADQIAVEAAIALIDAMTGIVVAQATANTETDVATWLAGKINALSGMSETGITVVDSDISFDSFSPASAETLSAAGVDGSFSFTVTLQRGNSATLTTAAPLNGEITATPYDATADNAAITAAKALIEATTFEDMQVNVSTAAQAKTAVEAILSTLSLNGVTTVVNDGDFTVAVAGMADNPSGTNGSYTFTVTLSRGGGTPQTTATLTLTIIATLYTAPSTYSVTVGTTNNGAVTASPSASVEVGTTVRLTINPASGYVLDVITAYRNGFPYIFVTLAGSSGSNVRTFTMPAYNVTVSATFKKSTDLTDIETARDIIEGMSVVTVAQKTANTTTAVRNWLAAQINALAGMSDTGITVAASNITLGSGFKAATAGTAANPSGSNGSFTFTVSLQKGNSVTITTASRNGIITATPYTAPPTYSITVNPTTNGSITASPSGNVTAGTTVTLTITPASGYELDAVSVYHTGAPSVTVVLTGSASVATRTFTMPANNVTVTASFRKTQAQLDKEAVEAAIAAIEGGNYRVAQATANDISSVTTWLRNTLNLLLGQSHGVQFRSMSSIEGAITINSNFTAAVTGTEAIPNGINGAFTFTATLTLGETTMKTTVTPGVIVATPHASTTVKRIELLSFGNLTVRILNSGNVPTGELTLTLTGANADVFNLPATTVSSLDVGSEAEVILVPRADLAAGTYTATLTVSGSDLTSEQATITYTVALTANENIDTVALKAWVDKGVLHVDGLVIGQKWAIYNISGTLIYQGIATDVVETRRAPSLQIVRGVYIIQSGNRTVKVMN